MKRRFAPILGMGLCAGLAGACTVGPDYAPPRLATPPSYAEAPADAKAAPLSVVNAGPADLAAWWTQFGDPELNRLVERALKGNLDLQAAASRIRQARQQEIVAGAPGLPSVTATGAGVRLRRSGGESGDGSNSQGGQSSGQSGGSGGAFTLPSGIDVYSAGFDATWEIDLFGGVRRSVEAARANTEAALWSRRDAEVSLSAEVANDYLAYRALQAQAAAVAGQIGEEENTLNVVRSRARHGVVTQLDVDQENAQLATLRAELPQVQAQARAQVHALGVLLGEQPEALSEELAASAPTPGVPASLPVGLPSDLLRRRPDVREAERQLAAATAEVGVAVANLYPTFDLIGLASLSADSLGHLFSDPGLTTGAVGLIQWPIFQGGRVRASIAANEEKRTQAYLAYRKAVLVAVRDVEDALARYGAEQQHNVALRDGEKAARAALAIASDQYGHGVVNGLNVLSAQKAFLRAQEQRAQSDGALAQALASLYKALGGGWSEDRPAA
jgi:NodT family efflux transporter outer membrane factor (OMF) lipoprotein